jgi:lysyl-tRNA synthetase class 1
MTRYVLEALDQRDRVATILTEHTGKQMPADWSPFSPLCPACGKINQARVTGFSVSDETVSYECSCSSAGSVPIAGGGKLNWRIDWPARWMALGVTVEPFGKDHSTSGGSYDTGAQLIRDIYGGEPPLPIPYEWIRLAGKGDMSSSKGNVLSIGDILEVAPPEALRYLVLRERPQKTIKFDPGLPLLRLVDELDDDSAAARDPRAVELSQAAGFSPVGLSYKHLVVVAQIAGFDPDRTIAILDREGQPGISREGLVRRLVYARKWLDSFAPEDLKFTVQPLLPAEVAGLDEPQRGLLGQLSSRLKPDMDGDTVHNLIFELASDAGESNARTLFQAIYIALLGKPRGPRAGWFIALLDYEFCRRRFDEASGGKS